MKKWPISIEPSLLSADFGNIAEEAKRAEQSGADALHLDIMDGHFVKNLTFGPRVVAAVNRATDLFLDVHLMIYNPFEYIESFAEAGADRITIHFEATEEVAETLNFIRRCNIEAGLAFRPETSLSMIPKYLDQADLILIMTVNPGFGGQAFMPEMLDKVRHARQWCNQLRIRKHGKTVESGEEEKYPPYLIQVDGGIDAKTAPDCVKAGANVLVSGSYLFKQNDMGTAIRHLKHLEGTS